jgi:hypothetical protein
VDTSASFRTRPGVLDGATEAGAAAEGVAEQVRLPKAEILDQPGDVVAEALEAEGAASVPGVTMALHAAETHRVPCRS